MAIHFTDGPTERGKFLAQRLQPQRVGNAAQALQLVVINDRGQPVQPVVRCKQRGFPIAALTAFAVAHQDKGAP